MEKTILEKKIGMIQIFDADGKVVLVAVVEAGPYVIVQEKTIEEGSYEAAQVGFGDVREKLANEPKKGHYARAGVLLKRRLKKFRLEDYSAYEVGQEIKADLFEAGDKIDVSGVPKGKGLQGVIKRRDANRGPMTHGSKFHRVVGSMGASLGPSRAFGNKNMPRHMGAVSTTILNLEVTKTVTERNLILIKGGIPGPNKGTVVMRNAVKT